MGKITTKEAADRSGVSTARIRQLILDGELLAEKFGNSLAIEESDLAKVKFYGAAGRPPKPKRAVGRPAKAAAKGKSK